MAESMCQDSFLSKNATTAWEFLEDLAEKPCNGKPLAMTI